MDSTPPGAVSGGGEARNHRAWLQRLATTPFERIYHWWNQIHAAVITILVIAAELQALRPAALLALAVWTPGALLALYRLADRFHPDGAGALVPNLLTSTRVAAAGSLFALVAADTFFPVVGEALRGGWGFPAVGILLLVELTDFFDGLVARRVKTGRFGSTWDMESDAVFAVALAVSVRHLHGVAPHVLAIGLMRYLYVLLWRYDGDPVVLPRIYKMYAKTTAAIVVTSLILGLVPVLTAGVRRIGYLAVLLLLIISFSWDLVLQRRSAKASR